MYKLDILDTFERLGFSTGEPDYEAPLKSFLLNVEGLDTLAIQF